MTALLGIRPSGLRPFLEHQFIRFRTTWRGTITAGVLGPLLFLLSIGVGLGSQIDAAESDLGTADYLSFVGPGLMAAAAMNLGASESLWQTAGALRWQGSYVSALSTPLTVAELVVGHVLWIGFRAVISAVLYLFVLLAFGVVESPVALLAPFAAGLTAVAFAAPISAWTGHTKNEMSFPMILRVGITPLFLFSGAFFPVAQLPGILPELAKLTPVWHGVRLCRGLIAGNDITIGSAAVHCVVLLAFTTAGCLAANHTFRNELAS